MNKIKWEKVRSGIWTDYVANFESVELKLLQNIYEEGGYVVSAKRRVGKIKMDIWYDDSKNLNSAKRTARRYANKLMSFNAQI